MAEFDAGAAMREAFASPSGGTHESGLNMRSAIRLYQQRCPECGWRLTGGYWLRWCPARTGHFLGPIERSREIAPPVHPKVLAAHEMIAALMERETDAQP